MLDTYEIKKFNGLGAKKESQAVFLGWNILKPDGNPKLQATNQFHERIIQFLSINYIYI